MYPFAKNILFIILLMTLGVWKVYAAADSTSSSTLSVIPSQEFILESGVTGAIPAGYTDYMNIGTKHCPSGFAPHITFNPDPRQGSASTGNVDMKAQTSLCIWILQTTGTGYQVYMNNTNSYVNFIYNSSAVTIADPVNNSISYITYTMHCLPLTSTSTTLLYGARVPVDGVFYIYYGAPYGESGVGTKPNCQ